MSEENTVTQKQVKGMYWVGKKRDKNTLKKLSESKYKKILQYSSEGVLVKEWNSIKEVATNVFNDYQIVNGGAKSIIYRILQNKLLSNRFNNDSYWFKQDEIVQEYGAIPNNIDVNSIILKQKTDTYSKRMGNKNHTTTYTVNVFNEHGQLVNTFNDVKEASKHFNIHISTMSKLCRFKKNIPDSKNYLSYGKKTKKLIK